MHDISISQILGLWKIGFVNESAVVAWADNAISKGTIPQESVTLLSLYGPKKCEKDFEDAIPQPLEFSFFEEFYLRLYQLNLDCTESKIGYLKWLVKASLEQEDKSPEVEFGLMLDHLFDYNEEDPMLYFNRRVVEFQPQSEALGKKIEKEIGL